MTTAVYFKGVLAADRFITHAAGGVGAYADKIYECPEGWLVVAGDIQVLDKLCDWFIDNCPEDECVDADGAAFFPEEGQALLVRPGSPQNEAWVLDRGSTHWTMVSTHVPVCIGSGGQYAAGAAWMHSGPDECAAGTAVRVAAIFDPYTKVDHGVQEVRCVT